MGDAGEVRTSGNGLSWATHAISGETGALLDVIYHDGQYVAVGEGGIVYTSPDGETWTSQSSDTTEDLSSVVWGDDEYVALGSGVVTVSVDGEAWAAIAFPGEEETGDIIWTGDRYLASAGQTIYSSADGVTWTPVTIGE